MLGHFDFRMNFKLAVTAVLSTIACSHAVLCAAQVSGTVLDRSGAVIAGATVDLRSEGASEHTKTDTAGRFSFARALPSGVVTVRAEGFAPASTSYGPATPGDLRITLEPSNVLTEMTVSATRTPVPAAEVPASVEVVTSAQFESSAARSTDDILRQVAGFDLFRRTSSEFSNPTTQGVSLRGIGSSGASRAVVLVDGVPLNDPFGGWVYWDRVPVDAINSAELLQGGSSALYGSQAMGGTINLARRASPQPWLAADLSYGSLVAPDASAAGGVARGKWAASAAYEAFTTDGYVMVDPSVRGTVDVPADSSHRTGELTVTRKFWSNSSLFGRGSWFREERGNGTPLQVNDTGSERGVVGGDVASARAGTFSFRFYGGPELYHQSFSTIATDRNSESLNRLQEVPVQELGGWAQWSRAAGDRQFIVAGVDVHDVRGHSLETAISKRAPTGIFDAGGRQRNNGIFGEDLIRATKRLTINAALRVDVWRNFDSFSDSLALANKNTSFTPFPIRQESAVSPRVGARYQLTSRLTLTAAGYRSFRAPTLNELYRSFRVGNVVTGANNGLRAEHSTGAEAGLIAQFGERVVVRGSYFWNGVEDPIANVTLTTTPTLITRQRQNLGNLRSQGVDAQVQARFSRAWFLNAEYQYTNSIVTSFIAEPALVGLWIPEVPHQQFTMQASFSSVRLFTAAVQMRAVGQQYDDDLNQFRLEPYAQLDVFFSRNLSRGIEVFVAGENLLNQRYSVARTPVRTIAPPPQARAGVRLRWGQR